MRFVFIILRDIRQILQSHYKWVMCNVNRWIGFGFNGNFITESQINSETILSHTFACAPDISRKFNQHRSPPNFRCPDPDSSSFYISIFDLMRNGIFAGAHVSAVVTTL